ncbi:U-actitoxin-Avd3q-like [Drosophila subpulchrella]|uniref:U-actitoxin-Avd3q-like n=1 Tax=Drosophila subpulchrella TaxID=1486046 RepID=UPI0018A19746|nr:U-actitoxin-Avd3q-like [Drosophila subpulchrella]
MKLLSVLACVFLCVSVTCAQESCNGLPRDGLNCERGKNEGLSGWNCQRYAMKEMWYWDQRSRKCRKMRYLGCRGNKNRYCSLSHCQRLCPNRP